jgi:hypothetical protein
VPIQFTCPYCGQQTLVQDQYIGQSGPCAGCGRTVTVFPPGAPAYQPLGENAGIRMLLPVGRSAWAIAAGYAGLFAVLVFPAPLALLFGILAIRDIKRHPDKHGMGRAIFGLVMGALFTIMLAFALIGGAITGFK